MATYRWIGGAGGFAVASNWEIVQSGVLVAATTPPSSGDFAQITGSATISGSGTADQLTFDALTTISGDDQIGTYSIISDANAADVMVAANWYDSSTLIIGEIAAGTLTIMPGATAQIGNDLLIGLNAGSSGTLIIGVGATLETGGTSDVLGDTFGASGKALISGAGALWSMAGQITVGANGSATISVTDGGSLASSGEYDGIGVFGSSSGIVTVDGVGSQWSSEDEIAVGCTGDGTLIISDDGSVSSEDITGVALAGGGDGTLIIESGGVLSSAGETAAIGDATGGSGSVTITGPDSAWRMSSNLVIGLLEPGSVAISAGGLLETGGTSDVLGNASGAFGAVTVTGSGAVWSMTGELTVGENGTGDIAISDGGSLASGGEYDALGLYGDSSGTVTVDGAGSQWSNEDEIAVGCTGDGTLIISNDGSVSSDDITGVALTGGGDGTLIVESGGVLSSAGETAAIGDGIGGSGSVTITGADSTWRMSSELGVGIQETGSVLVSSGGTLSTGGSVSALGVLGGSGTIVVDGVGSNWQSTGEISIGGTSGGTGAAIVSDDGLITAPSLTVGLQVGNHSVITLLSGATIDVSGPLQLGAETIGPATGVIEIGSGALLSATTLDINAAGSLALSGGMLAVAAPTDLLQGGILAGAGTITGSIASAGTIVATGVLSFLGQLGGGVLDIEPGGDAVADTAVLAGTTIDFTHTSGRLDLINPASFAGTVAGFAGGDTIFAAGAPSIAFGGGRLVTLLDSDGGNVGTITLAGSYAAGAIVDSGGTITDPIACFVAGTRIATPDGEVAVEDLKIGDRIMTQSGDARPVKWIGQRSYAGRFIAGRRDALPIVVAAGAIADGIPARDLALSPKHALFIDGALIPAELLVNGRTIIQRAKVASVTYHHVELDSHDILFADGMAAESFIDLDSRMMFHNAPQFMALYPEQRAAPAECAPRIEDGEALQAVRRRLAARAGLANCHARDAKKPGALDGRVDEIDHTGLSGWAFDPARPHSPVQLEILDGERRLGEVVADRHRADLAAAGKGGGRCAFTLRFDRPLDPGSAHFVRLRRIEDGASLGAPLVLPGQPASPGALDGRIDQIDDRVVAGWARDVAWPNHPVLLEVLEAGRVMGTVLANRMRPDLKQAGLGACAFTFRLSTSRGRVELRRASDGARLESTSRSRIA